MADYDDAYKRYVYEERLRRQIRREQGLSAPAPVVVDDEGVPIEPDPVVPEPIVEPEVFPLSPHRDSGGSG